MVVTESEAAEAGFADVRFTRDWRRVRCLDSGADLDMLQALESTIRAQLSNVGNRKAIMQQLEDSFSNMIQLSPVKGCLSDNPEKEIKDLTSLYCEHGDFSNHWEPTGRQLIVSQMIEAFQQANLLKLLLRNVPMSPYTKPGDPLKLDFGCVTKTGLQFFHALSLKSSVNQAITLASRYPKVASHIKTVTNLHPQLTAVVDDNLDRSSEQIDFALSMLSDSQIQVATAQEIPAIANVMRKEIQSISSLKRNIFS